MLTVYQHCPSDHGLIWSSELSDPDNDTIALAVNVQGFEPGHSQMDDAILLNPMRDMDTLCVCLYSRVYTWVVCMDA